MVFQSVKLIYINIYIYKAMQSITQYEKYYGLPWIKFVRKQAMLKHSDSNKIQQRLIYM